MVNVVGILGAGKMGLAMARNFAAAGVRVVAYDPMLAARMPWRQRRVWKL